MSMRSGLFDSTEIVETESGYPRGNKAEAADFFARYFAAFIGNGVYARPSNGFQVFAYDGLTVHVKAGSAFINGYFAFDDEDDSITLTSGLSDTVYRVILRLDTNYGTISLAVLEDDTSLTRTGGIYELGLADVSVTAGALSVSQSDIRDLRADNALCGFVTGTITQLDTSTYAAQLDGIIADASEAYGDMTDYIEISEEEFNEWFESMRNQLSTDAAGHLEQTKAERDLSNVSDGAVSERFIGSSAVTAAKIGGGAIITDKIADNAVTSVKLGGGAVVTEKIADNAVTSEKLGEDIRSSLSRITELCYGIKLV